VEAPGPADKVREDLLNDRLLQEGGDDLQLTAAVRAVLEVELEHPLEQPGPTQPHRPVVPTIRLVCGGLRCLGGRHRLLWTTCARIFALGASTPWKRIRCSLGLGTSAARRCMNSSGDITRCVVPSTVEFAPPQASMRHGQLRGSDLVPANVADGSRAPLRPERNRSFT
jgi:hypothetical protein